MSVSQIDLNSFDAVLKTKFDKRPPEYLKWEDKPLHTLLKKKEDFSGKGLVYTIKVGLPAGTSNTFSSAKANQGIFYDTNTGMYVDLTLTLAKYYGVHSIEDLTMNVAKGQEGTFLDGQLEMIQSIMDSVEEQVAIAEYRSGSGSIGKRASISSNTITLSNAEDSHNFEVGQKIVAAAAETAGALRAGSAIVVAVDYDAGTVTVDNAAGITDFANNDFLFLDGNRNLGLKGLAAWIPDTAPTSGDNFFGVDRSSNPVRLAGSRLNAASLTIEEALVKMSHTIAKLGGKPDIALMSFDRHQELVNSLGSKVQYVEHKVGTIGFKTLIVEGPKGAIKCVADSHCPNNRIYVLTSSTWELHSAKAVPHIVQGDGLRIMRAADQMSYEVRVAAYCQMATRAPGFNGVIKLDA